MTAAVRKTDEELISNKKCMISGLMTDLGSSNGLMCHNEKITFPARRLRHARSQDAGSGRQRLKTGRAAAFFV